MLIANMVGRNEADRFLVPVLSRLAGIADFIVFMDDCSTDDTMEIAKKYCDVVVQTPEPTFSTNEGLLRQSSWDEVDKVAKEGDWILSIDCDEELFGLEHLKPAMESGAPVLGIQFFHMWNKTHFRIDKAWAPTIGSRLFKYEKGGHYLDRKLACGAEPTYVVDYVRKGMWLPRTGLRMKHLGYERDEDKQMKYDRYMSIDRGDYHSLVHLESILDKTPTLVEWYD
jgi:glycosyltransferase involved in cell wall biosynthesis